MSADLVEGDRIYTITASMARWWPSQQVESMPRVALITDTTRVGGIDDDRPFVDALADRKIEAVHVPWGGRVDADAALIRTPWDYFHRAGAFADWLDRVPVPVWNPPAMVRWNLDKRYLLDLGVRLPRTRVLAAGEVTVEEESVVKPVVSAGGHDTFRLTPSEPIPPLRPGLWLVQEYLPQVAVEGEVSVIVIDGVPTHAVRKTPRGGGFLVHEEHGGRTVPTELTGDDERFALETVEAVRTRFGELPLYARVDTVAGRLLELELIEPELFFRFGPAAAAALAEGVARRLQYS